MTRPLRALEAALWTTGLVLVGWCGLAWVEARVVQSAGERLLARPTDPVRDGSGSLREASRTSVDPGLVGAIRIPRLGISAVVREGADARTLRLAVGHVPGTAPPGGRGNVCLAGHRDTFFRNLARIRRGDVVVLQTPTASYRYVVDGARVVGPGATWVLGPTARPALTLVTCYPFGWIGAAPDRFVVRAHRDGDPPAPPRRG